LVGWDAKDISAATTPVLVSVQSARVVQSNRCVMMLGPAAALDAKTDLHTYGWTNQVDVVINTNKYVSWDVVPQDGVVLTVTNLHVSLWRNGSGATNLAIRSSLDGFQADLDFWTVSANGAVDHETTLSSGLVLSNSVEFRLYMWGAGISGASTYLRTSIPKSVAVSGIKSGLQYVPWLDVVNCGAVADDELDDAPVFQEILDVLAAGGGGTLYIPPGYFVFSNQVSVAAGNVEIGIIGEGNGSRIYGWNTNGLFRFDFSDNRAQLGLSNFTCVATAPTNGTGLEVNAPAGGSGDGRTLTMHKVEFVGNDIARDSFHRAVVGDGLWRPRLSIVTVGGPFGPNASYTNIYLTEVCYRFSNVDQPVFESCSAWCAQTGYDIGLRSAATEPLFNHCQAVSVVHAMNVRSAGTNQVSGVSIRGGCHPNGTTSGLFCERLSDFTLEGMVFYHSPAAELINTNYLDLILSNCVNGTLSGSIFHYNNPRTQIAVADDCSGIQIADNFFNVSSFGSPVRIEDALSVSRMKGNLFNYVHADEQDTAALWHMDSAVAGPTNYIADDDALNPSRDNHLNLNGCFVDTASTNLNYDGALVFSQSADYAESQGSWSGAPGIRIDTYVYFDSDTGQQNVMSSAYTFIIQSMASSVRFLWQNQVTNDWQILSVNNAVTTGAWHRIIAEVNPAVGTAFLEVDGVGRSSMEIGSDYLAANSSPILFGQGGNSEFLGKIDETAISALAAVGAQTLTVATPYGQAMPAIGKYWIDYGSSNSAWVIDSPVVSGTTTQYVCAGWTGTGNIPASGASTNTGSFTLTTNSTLTWLWTTNYWLTASATTGGTVDVSNGWKTNGAVVQITAETNLYYHFNEWTGDAVTNSSQITLAMTGPRTVTANFAPNVTANTATPEWWLAQYGFTNFTADAVADADGDGQLSWQEYIAGTNPTNSASSFRITGGSVTPAGIVIRWSSESNRTYNLSRTTNLLEAFAGFVGATNLPATPPENVYTNRVSDGDSAFYQIRVQQ
jgi:hypothetical protein